MILLLVLPFNVLMAQNHSVSGVVADANGEPLIGVTVIVEGTTLGTSTAIDGSYALTNVPIDGTLIYSFIGMLTQSHPINGQSTINITLLEDSEMVDEVVVVGYGTMKVKDLTSSITTVKADDLMKTPAGQAVQALQGKVAGVQIVSNGSPGDSPTIRVRGIGSYPGNGSENPLFVVDGVLYDNIDFLNSADIESMSVLKDASASAIYGVRAANGVVLIETKSGKKNQKATITYDGYYGVQVAADVLKMANSEQYAQMIMESGSDADIAKVYESMQQYGRSHNNPNVPATNTNWYDEVMRTASIQNHSLNVAGGSENAIYSLGLSYFDQEGILDMPNDYTRLNLRAKLDYDVNELITVGGNIIFSDADKNAPESGAWRTAYFAVPIMPVYDGDNLANAKSMGYRGSQNPFVAMNYNRNALNIQKTLASFYAKINIIPNKLNFKTSYSKNVSDLTERYVRLPYDIGYQTQRLPEEASIRRVSKKYTNETIDNVLTYTDSFDKHNVTVMAGHSYRNDEFVGFEAKGLDFPYQDEKSWYLNQAKTIEEGSVFDYGSKSYGISYFGRVSYSFDNKYLLYGTFRADGTSIYQEKWGYFPTVGVGWVLSEEDFMSDVPFVDFLKVRASWGELGNNNVPANDGTSTANVVDAALGDNKIPGTVNQNIYSFLKWEVSTETNFGITSTLFNSRLSVEADYYVRDTDNAAIRVQEPFTSFSTLRNVGVIRNSGFELAVNWNDKISDDWSYSVGFNMSTLKNEVRDLYGQAYIDAGQAEFRQRSAVGEPLMSFYGWKTDGVYQNDAEIAADPIAVANGLVPGDYRYVNQNGDDVIDDNDRVFLGSYFPDLTYGFDFSVNYKNWNLSASFYGQSGNKILNRKRGEILWTSDGNMDADLAKNLWRGEGTSNKYVSSAGLRKGWNQKMSNYFVEDGSFFRIQNIQLSYLFSNKTLWGVDMPDAKIIFTADRPVTFTDYNGFNPEIANGVDTQTYPIPATYTLGLNIKF
ncbi:TonB-dependent receptor [Marinifilum sp. JC070]|uniref:TonB-dependent receptor n=2 Tax=Marinifilum caeruleilacunae TaxID=2499076 RepID=A0ABX1X0K5_9BACT|nr:TonB-dependent receptor [Marinifilum caeruleilacunae]